MLLCYTFFLLWAGSFGVINTTNESHMVTLSNLVIYIKTKKWFEWTLNWSWSQSLISNIQYIFPDHLRSRIRRSCIGNLQDASLIWRPQFRLQVNLTQRWDRNISYTCLTSGPIKLSGRLWRMPMPMMRMIIFVIFTNFIYNFQPES